MQFIANRSVEVDETDSCCSFSVKQAWCTFNPLASLSQQLHVTRAVIMPAIKLIEPPQLLVDWNNPGGEDRRCVQRLQALALRCIDSK
jgi:hypothetical protein